MIRNVLEHAGDHRAGPRSARVTPAIGVETVVLTALTLIAFASNSILTRLALGTRQIDAATFTSVRLLAGAVTLTVLVKMRSTRRPNAGPGHWLGAVALVLYAVAFSYAYLRIGAGVGALALFGAVQVTMIGVGLWHGERPGGRTWFGLALSVAGLLMLLMPSATAARPDPLGIAVMAIAGVWWGVYSLCGRGEADPLVANVRNFARSLPPVIVLSALLYRSAYATATGIALAVACGSLTSGVGYAIWYRALRGLTATQAAVAQLSVPVLAAIGGVVLLGEMMTTRLIVSGLGVLGGVALALSAPTRGKA